MVIKVKKSLLKAFSQEIKYPHTEAQRINNPHIPLNQNQDITVGGS